MDRLAEEEVNMVNDQYCAMHADYYKLTFLCYAVSDIKHAHNFIKERNTISVIYL